MNELRAVSARLAQQALATPEPEEREFWQRQVAQLSAQQGQLESQVMIRSVTYRAAKEPVELEDVRSAIPVGAVLVDYLETNKEVFAFVVPREGDVQMLTLASRTEVSDMIDQWRGSFGSSDDAVDAGRWLREQLWSPLEPFLGEVEMVLVSPDGGLGRLPLAALPGKEPNTFLLEERALVMVTAPQMLPTLLSHHARSDAERRAVASRRRGL